MKTRKRPVALLALILLAAGVVSGVLLAMNSSNARAQDALRRVMATPGGNPWRLFPTKPGSAPCKLWGGGVVTTYTLGTCSTSVTLAKNGQADVRFHGSWGSGWLLWEYRVSGDGHVTPIRSDGNVIPGEGE